MTLKFAKIALLAAAAGSIAALAAQHGSAQGTDANGGLTLPPGFHATVFAENLGHARHMAVAADGTLYVNTWSGSYYRNSPPPPGGFLVALKDSDGDGTADRIARFGPTAAQGNAGGDGLALYKGGLYAESNDKIVRYALPAGPFAVPAGAPETVLYDMPLTGNHPMHPFAIDGSGNLFVNMGSATNACQALDRQPGKPGTDPCTETETRAGIWLYSAARTNQKFSPAERYSTGIRNTGGITWDSKGHMFAVQHGRDQLFANWGAHYTAKQSAELPSEVMVAPVKGGDFGWPYCYYDPERKSLMLAPEYGGDGKTIGRCAGKLPPVAAFPAHWAPNDVLAYTGGSFPTAFHDGVFIAFHGSWNRAPEPQAGYQLVFQPLKDGTPSGPWIRFADGFSGGYREPGRAVHRPAGLAQGPDGALYIADDVKGTIWRVTYSGPADAALAAAPEAALANDAGSAPSALPPGYSPNTVALGKQIYLGQAKNGTCAGCHGSDGRGTSNGPSLTGPQWLWGDGSVAAFSKIIATGVAEPKQNPGAMPPDGGVELTAQERDAVAAFVWSLGHGGH